MKVIVVGAGLTCAKVLTKRGHEVTVFEASDGVGARARTEALEGFFLDPGFQVYTWRVVARSFDFPDEEIYRRRVKDVCRWCPEAELEPLAIYRGPYAQ